jgi:hypothetical protein
MRRASRWAASEDGEGPGLTEVGFEEGMRGRMRIWKWWREDGGSGGSMDLNREITRMDAKFERQGSWETARVFGVSVLRFWIFGCA